MKNNILEYKIKDYVSDLQKNGTLTFSLNEIGEKFPQLSTVSIKSALRRLSEKQLVISVWKGFYAIIPVEYAVQGIVPPTLYLNSLMKYLKRPYYFALLDAAKFYAAAHQKPQQFTVITVVPPLHDTVKRNVKINFIATRKQIPQKWLKSIKSKADYIQVSSPELTAADLITFQKEIGGLNRACTVLYELMEVVKFGKLDKTFFDYVPVSTIQRLGYLLENKLEQQRQADILFSKAKTHVCKFQKIPLKYSKNTADCEFNQKWKIIVNEQIEIDNL
jgi:predicted transcriptional regulator of viral defense system